MCFRLENEGAIFAGDCIMNGSTAEFEDLSAYSMSLDRLLEAFSSANKKNKNYDNYDDCDDRQIDDRAKCYPSHGDVILDGERMTEGYLKHRTSRERQFLKELKTFGEKGANVWELAMKVYGKLVGALVFIMSCLKITKQHLEKMRQDGSVTVLQKQKFGILMILSYALAILSLGLLGSTNSTRYVVVMNANKNE
jgi:endoribonuclease LACTB2